MTRRRYTDPRHPWTGNLFTSADFDGVNDFIASGNVFGGLINDTPSTLLVWSYPRVLVGTQSLIAIGDGTQIRLYWQAASLTVGTSGVGPSVAGGITRQWHLCVAARDAVGGNAYVRLYRDGALVGAAQSGPIAALNAINFRYGFSAIQYQPNGRMAVAALFGRRLDDDVLLWLAQHPEADLRAFPDVIAVYAPGAHVGDSTAAGGKIYDFMPGQRPLDANNMDVSDLVLDAPLLHRPWVSTHSYEFDGVNEFGRWQEAGVPIPAAATGAFWVRLTAAGVDRAVFDAWGLPGGVTNDILLGTTAAGKARLRVIWGGVPTTTDIVSAADAPLGAWFHLAWTRTAADGTYRIYLAGADAGSAALGGAVGALANLVIGRYINGTHWWNGNIAQGAIYPEVLSPADIAILAANPTLDPRSRNAWWAFNACHEEDDTAVGGIMHDWIGGRHMVPTNMELADRVPVAP